MKLSKVLTLQLDGARHLPGTALSPTWQCWSYCLSWPRHTTLLQNSPRTLLAVKFWENFTVLRIHTGILFPASLSGRRRGQEIASCGCSKAAPSLPLPITQLCTHLPHTALNSQPSSLPDPLQPHQGTRNLNLYYLLIKTNITQQMNPKPRFIFLYKQLRKYQKG